MASSLGFDLCRQTGTACCGQLAQRAIAMAARSLQHDEGWTVFVAMWWAATAHHPATRALDAASAHGLGY